MELKDCHTLKDIQAVWCEGDVSLKECLDRAAEIGAKAMQEACYDWVESEPDDKAFWRRDELLKLSPSEVIKGSEHRAPSLERP